MDCRASWCAYFSFFLMVIVHVAKGQGSPEVAALIALKQSLADPKGVLASWSPNAADPCIWFHITCVDGSVTRIDLQSQSLSGALVPELGNLHNLRNLALENNLLVGSIPDSLGNLKKLVALDLFGNGLSGSIPNSLGGLSSLQFLRLQHNVLTGDIPAAITGLSTLLLVDLSFNDLEGVAPTFAANVDVHLEGNPKLTH